MSREIKFRAWDKCSEYMHSNVQSGVYEDPDDWTEFNTVLGLERFEVMQYTGLKDKNGKEIYEGDLLKHPLGVIAEINYADEFAAFLAGYFIGKSYRRDLLDPLYISLCEVIGNKYDNPELVEETA